MVSSFELDSRLDRDCLVVGDFPLCRLLLMNDSRYPWCILVPRVADVQEVYQLDEADQQQLLLESSGLARTLQALFFADKMNIAALGNVVAQLHIHHIVRYRSDAAWPAPVWGKHAAQPYQSEELAEVMDKLAQGLADNPSFTWLFARQ